MKKNFLKYGLLSVALLTAACGNGDTAEQPAEDTTEETTEQAETEETTENDGETAPTSFEPGTYDITAEGYDGEIDLSVEFSEDAIADVTIENHNETEGIGTEAVEQLPEQITENQSLNVNAISGATVTSEAIIDGVEQAVEEAGGDVEALQQAEVEQSEDIEETTNVVVVGGGGAGLSAAVEAAQSGSEVILLEKTDALGGNTILAGGPLNAVDPERQQNLPPASDEAMEEAEALTEEEPQSDLHQQYMDELSQDLEEYYAEDPDHLFDSEALHILQTYEGGDYEANLEFVEVLVQNAYETIEWLESNGVVWQDEVTTVPGGLWPRAHLPENAAGGDYIRANTELAEESGVEIITDAEVENLIYENDRVVGVTGTRSDGANVEVTTDQGVVLATGGFAANEEMRQEYDPALSEDLGTTNNPAIEGDGIRMAEEIDSNLIGMEDIQSLPLGTPGEGDLSGWVGGLGVEYYYQINQDGERFMPEDGRRDEMTDALLEQDDAMSYIISGSNNPEVQEGETTWGDDIDQLVENGDVYMDETIEGLAEQIDVPVDTFVETHEEFNSYVEEGTDPEFGRSLFGEPIEPPYYASPRSVTVHHTMGGLQINLDTQVIDVNGDIIQGLYAAGEVTGGIHGSNRLGGNALLDIHTFGRFAGENIANEEAVDVSDVTIEDNSDESEESEESENSENNQDETEEDQAA